VRASTVPQPAAANARARAQRGFAEVVGRDQERAAAQFDRHDLERRLRAPAEARTRWAAAVGPVARARPRRHEFEARAHLVDDERVAAELLHPPHHLRKELAHVVIAAAPHDDGAELSADVRIVRGEDRDRALARRPPRGRARHGVRRKVATAREGPQRDRGD
jgi:hypothetical protein